MQTNYLFISDLHLDPGRPEITQCFFNFLAKQARDCNALYILGDLFEVWIGDDDLSEFNQSILSALKQLTDSGVPAFFIQGNRDFLTGTEFEQQTGITILPDPFPVELAGQQVLLLHGDTLCTGDTRYQAFRAQVRDPDWQREFLTKTLAERRDIAKSLRAQSQLENSQKEQAIMDVEATTVLKVYQEYRPDLIIHGHTHRPGVHTISTDPDAKRIVLADWYEAGSYLELTDSGFADHALTLA